MAKKDYWNKGRHDKNSSTYVHPSEYNENGLWNSFEDIADDDFWDELSVDNDFEDGFIIEDEDGKELEGIDLKNLTATQLLTGGLEDD